MTSIRLFRGGESSHSGSPPKSAAGLIFLQISPGQLLLNAERQGSRRRLRLWERRLRSIRSDQNLYSTPNSPRKDFGTITLLAAMNPVGWPKPAARGLVPKLFPKFARFVISKPWKSKFKVPRSPRRILFERRASIWKKACPRSESKGTSSHCPDAKQACMAAFAADEVGYAAILNIV